jgi:hypothetical protein
MANRWWVGGTGTWDSTSTANWSTSSGGANGASAPVAGDTVIFDGSSGGGTVTPDGTIAGISFGSLTCGAFTGTLAFNTNNPNVSFTTVSVSGSGTRTINMGSGTWTLTGTSGTPFDCTTSTNLTPTFSNAAIVFSGNSSARNFLAGGQTYGSFTINNNSSPGYVQVTAGTFASITVGSGVTMLGVQGGTVTITGALTINGTSSAPSGLSSTAATTNVTTISVGSASALEWVGIFRVTKAGAGSITATNSLDMGGNTGITITAPSGGGVVGVIGG